MSGHSRLARPYSSPSQQNCHPKRRSSRTIRTPQSKDLVPCTLYLAPISSHPRQSPSSAPASPQTETPSPATAPPEQLRNLPAHAPPTHSTQPAEPQHPGNLSSLHTPIRKTTRSSTAQSVLVREIRVRPSFPP